ncbi:MAG TPA: peptide deformylase [Vicinamibacterales bacterium]|nr:peptide deformylase [Vicinamibacterales bacterium]
MLRPILRLGDSLLTAPAAPVGALTPEVDAVVGDMIETMYAAPGIGLAAPQIGVGLRIFVVDLSAGRDPNALQVMIDPEFVERDGMQLEEEGCLSIPGFTATVARPKRVVVRGMNRAGDIHTIEGKDLLARALQHEMDHLNACLFVDRLRGISRDLILRKIRKLQKAGRW